MNATVLFCWIDPTCKRSFRMSVLNTQHWIENILLIKTAKYSTKKSQTIHLRQINGGTHDWQPVTVHFIAVNKFKDLKKMTFLACSDGTFERKPNKLLSSNSRAQGLRWATFLQHEPAQLRWHFQPNVLGGRTKEELRKTYLL